MDEFNFYIQKMQNLLKNPLIQPLLSKRKSKELVTNFTLNLEHKKDKIDKIKAKIKENRKDLQNKQITSNIIEEIQNDEKQVRAESIINQEMNNQEENFKKRLEERRLLRGNSQPHMKLKAKLGEKVLESVEKIKAEQISKVNAEKHNRKNSGSQNKRKSVLTSNILGEVDLNIKASPTIKQVKPNLEIDVNSNEVNNFEQNINEIFDKDYENKIETNLLKIWETAQIQMRVELEKIEDEISKFLDQLAEEKFKKSVEILNKYDLELKDLLLDLDLSMF